MSEVHFFSIVFSDRQTLANERLVPNLPHIGEFYAVFVLLGGGFYEGRFGIGFSFFGGLYYLRFSVACITKVTGKQSPL